MYMKHGFSTAGMALPTRPHSPTLAVGGFTRRLASTEARAWDLSLTATVSLDDGFRQFISWWCAGRALESALVGALV